MRAEARGKFVLSGANHIGSVPTTALGSHHDVNEANAALVAFRYVMRLEWSESLFT